MMNLGVKMIKPFVLCAFPALDISRKLKEFCDV